MDHCGPRSADVRRRTRIRQGTGQEQFLEFEATGTIGCFGS